MQKVLNFIKYNNAMVLILAAVFLFAAGAFAQTEEGREIIGEKQTRVEGVDNTLLLAADLDKIEMDFKIEKIEEDEKMYYVTYTFLDLDKLNGAWQYQLKEKTRKVSKKIDGDLGEYMLKELHEQYLARAEELREAKIKAEESGEEKRVEITEYSGLVGKTLDLAASVIPGYESVKKMEVASPEAVEFTYKTNRTDKTDNAGSADNLTEIYNDYISEHAEEIAELDENETAASEPIAGSTEEIPLAEETASTTEETLEGGNEETAAAAEGAAEEISESEPEVEIIELPE